MRDYALNRAMAAESIGTSFYALFRNWRARRQMAVLAKCDDKHLQELGIIRTWIRGKLDAIRQKQIVKREITYLRTMDDHMLKDMGIDISALVEIYPSLESSRNNLKCETSGFFNLPVNMSTR